MPSRADDLLHSTYILGIREGAPLSGVARGLNNGGYYYLADGETRISFDQWYRTDWPALTFDMLTQTGDDFGILWSFSTSERGEKYLIEPSVSLGFIAQAHPKPNSTLSLTVNGTLGGHMTEFPCQGDYGDIGGSFQTVNCRFAADPSPTADTLQYLVNADASKLSVMLSFGASF